MALEVKGGVRTLGTSQAGSATEQTPAAVFGALTAMRVPSSTAERSMPTDAVSRSMSARRSPIYSPHRIEANTASKTKARYRAGTAAASART